MLKQRTKKRTITIPAEVKRKYGLRKSSEDEFAESGQGVLMVPAIPFHDLYGVDKARKKLIHRMIREIHEERRREKSKD